MATTLAMHIDLERPCRQAFYPNLPQTRGVLLYDWLKRTVLILPSPRGAPQRARSRLDLAKGSMGAKATVEHGNSSPGPPDSVI